MKLELTLPVNGSITQFFGGNANPSYAGVGLKGHTAIDIVSSYNDTITNAVKGCNKQYVYSLMNKGDPDLMRYRAVFQIVEADNGVFEVSYGHCNNITCSLGPSVYGSPLATEGNTGEVYVGSHEVSEAEKIGGSRAGTHVHFQVRRLRKVKMGTLHSLSLANGQDFIDSDGFHFDVPAFENGYNGCIDPLQFIGTQNNYKFTRQLDKGSIGYDVFQLQRRLVALGFATFTPTGFFGSATAQAVSLYQEANNLDVVGRVGPLTIKSLNI